MAKCPCGKEHHRTKKNGPCPACYMRAYRSTPSGKKAAKRAQKKWNHSEAGRRSRRNYYRRKHGIPEDLREVRQAVKRLEAAVSQAERR